MPRSPQVASFYEETFNKCDLFCVTDMMRQHDTPFKSMLDLVDREALPLYGGVWATERGTAVVDCMRSKQIEIMRQTASKLKLVLVQQRLRQLS